MTILNNDATCEQVMAAYGALFTYLGTLVAAKRDTADDDLLSRLVTGGDLSDEETDQHRDPRAGAHRQGRRRDGRPGSKRGRRCLGQQLARIEMGIFGVHRPPVTW